MGNGYRSEHWSDGNNMPLGGVSYGTGFAISWQHGPLGRGEQRRPPNGAFVEDVIDAVRDRLEYYQASPFTSSFNARAIDHLTAALTALRERTHDRERREVEGTHEQ